MLLSCLTFPSRETKLALAKSQIILVSQFRNFKSFYLLLFFKFIDCNSEPFIVLGRIGELDGVGGWALRCIPLKGVVIISITWFFSLQGWVVGSRRRRRTRSGLARKGWSNGPRSNRWVGVGPFNQRG